MKQTRIIIEVVVSLLLSLLPSLLWPIGLQATDICNKAGIPFVAVRTGLCPTGNYDWTGINVLYATLNILIWGVALFIIIHIVAGLFVKKK